MASRRCILHLSSSKFSATSDTVIPFDVKTWDQTQKSNISRREQFKKSKYFEVTLPQKYDEETGYHSKCYSDFTSVSTSAPNNDLKKPKIVPTLRSEVPKPKTSSSGVYKPMCIFCDKDRKRIGEKSEWLGKCETDTGEENIKASALKLQRHDILAKVSGIDIKAKEVRYHHSCRRDFLNEARALDSTQEPAKVTQDHKLAFEKLKQYIQGNIVDNSSAELLTSLHKRYKAFLPDDSTYSADSLCSKVVNEFNGLIMKHKISNKKGVILHSSTLTPTEATAMVFFDESALSQTAKYIRQEVLQLIKTEDEQNKDFTTESLLADRKRMPKSLYAFFRILYTGNCEKPVHPKTERRIHSVCDDVLYGTTRGKIKPMKHILLGLGMKSITGSRKVVEILNRYGQSVSYHSVEERETAIATEIMESGQVTPDGIEKEVGRCTAMAWDNYDEFNDTLSGAGSVHDCVGVCYQNITQLHRDPLPCIIEDSEGEDQASLADQDHPPCSSEENTLEGQQLNPADQAFINSAGDQDHAVKGKRASKRTIEYQERFIEPYRKKPKTQDFDFLIRYIPPPSDLTRISRQDNLWMISSSIMPTPMWVGWNARLTTDPLPLQRITYMENITLPPTRLDVVAETMKISKKIAEECGEEYAVITYDLAIAKPALQIQATEAPLYNKIFICFGAFHILLAYFGALGYFLDGSGGPHILVDSGVLASGSLNGFILGKHYNKCKRLHSLLAEAMQILHFRMFLHDNGQIPPQILEIVHQLNESPSEDYLKSIENASEYTSFMDKYDEYIQTSLRGEHGSTAKYWVLYIQLENQYKILDRACRTNNLDLFIHALSIMCPVFFACNRPNYARWMTCYHLNLINVENTHPGVRSMLENGALSIRRTSKDFSRTAVDITLEQTVNADAASRHTGIAAFMTSAAAKCRWMVTKTARSNIVGCLLLQAGLKKSEDITQQLKPYRIARDYVDLQKVISHIEETMNPFEIGNVDTSLYCLSSGKSVVNDIADELLNCLTVGKKWMEEYKFKCANDPRGFDTPINRRKIKNFLSSAVKVKLMAKDLKIKELECTMDLFGKLLYLAWTYNIDLAKVFQYPLTPIPFSLGNIDGGMHSTKKDTLLHKLEGMGGENTEPSEINVCLVDAPFDFRLLINLGKTYEDVAKEILARLCRMGKEVHYICDRSDGPYIKDVTDEKRNQGNQGTQSKIQISGPRQHRPSDWNTAVKSGEFKTALVEFLAEEWRRPQYKSILRDTIVMLTCGEYCYKFYVLDGSVRREVVPELECSHIEADTRIIFHWNQTLGGSANTVVSVRCNDTDVFILLLYHYDRYQRTHNNSPQIWMDVGKSSDNSRRMINISKVADKLEPIVIQALPGLHALTGNDYSPTFTHKGKIRPFSLMLKDKSYMEALSLLGEEDVTPDQLLDKIEPFICALYGKPQLKDVDKVRLQMFTDICKPKKGGNLFSRMKKLNPTSFPPCRLVLFNQVKRGHLITNVFKKAWHPTGLLMKPDEYGWVLVNGKYCIKWFDGEQVPTSLGEVISQEALPSDDPEEGPLQEDSDDNSESDEEDDDENEEW